MNGKIDKIRKKKLIDFGKEHSLDPNLKIDENELKSDREI
jgi:hypothetical protein